MKFLTAAIALQIFSVVSARSAAEYAALVQECGDLGVMEVPEGADPSQYRHCEAHPLGTDRRKYKEQSLAPVDEKRSNAGNIKAADIFGRKEQACWWESSFGCTGRYCWKSCGKPGEWCWTAAGDGGGKWLECRNWSDCNTKQNCGKGCRVSKSCGCGC